MIGRYLSQCTLPRVRVPLVFTAGTLFASSPPPRRPACTPQPTHTPQPVLFLTAWIHVLPPVQVLEAVPAAGEVDGIRCCCEAPAAEAQQTVQSNRSRC